MRGVQTLGAAIWLALGGCGKSDTGADPHETDVAPTDPTDTEAAADEECNGADDDGDGEVDEGFADSDGDGTADCVDACTYELPGAGPASLDAGCTAGTAEVPDPWSVVQSWWWTTLPGDLDVAAVVAPVAVGDLTGDAVPEVAFVAEFTGTDTRLVVLDGETSAMLWTRPANNAWASVVVADVDGDGRRDVVVYDKAKQASAYDGSGNLMWTSAVTGSAPVSFTLVGDVDGDGLPEVLFQNHLLDGVTGALERTYEEPFAGTLWYYSPVIADLDLDGSPELVFGSYVFDAHGDVLWTDDELYPEFRMWTAVVQADDDPEAEVIMISPIGYRLYEHDGTQTVFYPFTGYPGAPCIDDFDGDGVVEVAFATGGIFTVRELDGSVLWAGPTYEDVLMHPTGCAAFDFDADGAVEIVYGDAQSIYIYDGLTGAVHVELTDHSSYTYIETPVIADVDLDGSADLIYVDNNPSDSPDGGEGGVHVISHAAGLWPPSTTSWATYNHGQDGVLADGTIASAPTPWLDGNRLRSQPTEDPPWPLPDLVGEIVEVCANACDPASVVEVVAVVSNVGAAATPGDVPVALYRDEGSELTLLGASTVPGPLDAGQAAAAVVFEIFAVDLGFSGLVLRVGDDGGGGSAVRECLLSNNDTSSHDDPCM